MNKFNKTEALRLFNQVQSDCQAVQVAYNSLSAMSSAARDAVLGGAHYDVRKQDKTSVYNACKRINARAWQDWLYDNDFNHRYSHYNNKANTATYTLCYADLFNDNLVQGVKLGEMQEFSVETAESFYNMWLSDSKFLLKDMLTIVMFSMPKLSKKCTFKTTAYRSDSDYKVANLHYIVAVLLGLDFSYKSFYSDFKNTNLACDVFSYFDDESIINIELQSSGNYTIRLRADVVDALANLNAAVIL